MKMLQWVAVAGTAVMLSACSHLPAAHFQSGSAHIQKSEYKVIDEIADRAASRGYLNYHVRVMGFTDTAGDKASNHELAKQRAYAVKNALVARGIMASRISISAKGEDKLAVRTNDGVDNYKNRRVEIEVMPHSFWLK